MKHKNLENRLSLKQKRFFAVLIFTLTLCFVGLLCYFVGDPMIRFVSEPQKFRAWVDDKGFLGKLFFVGMVFFQTVIAVIPGEPFEIGAGYAFGAIEGTLLTMIGITLGSILIFWLTRHIGIRFVEVFFPIEKIRSLKFLQNTKKVRLIIFLVFFIPGTPKDLLSYFIGLTDIKFSSWILIAAFARIPSIITSTMGGNALGERKYISAVVIFVISAIISATGYFIYGFICRRNEKKG